MATGNVIQTALVSNYSAYSSTGTRIGGGYNYSDWTTSNLVQSYATDDDFNTAFGTQCGINYGQDWYRSVQTLARVYFRNPKNITNMQFKMSTLGYCNYIPAGGSYYHKVVVYCSAGTVTPYYISGGSQQGTILSDTSISGNWDAVTKIEVVSYSEVSCRVDSGSNGNGYCGAYFYGLRATGTIYQNSGMYIRNDNVNRAIGCEALTASHSLRLQKATEVVGIPLLETNDGEATPIRIYTPHGIKSVPYSDY